MGLFDRLFGRKTAGETGGRSAGAASGGTIREISGKTARETGAVSPDASGPLSAPVFRVGNIQGIGGREHQEDSFAVLNVSDPEKLAERGLLAVVADGMGGMAGGDFAASEQVFRQFGGMSGTTLAAVHIREDGLHWVSVGDSAIFLMRNGGVFQLNREHNYLNQLYVRELEEETIHKERAEQDVDARRLTSFVGIDHLREVDLNLRPWRIRPGDVLLLCSDGISGVLTPPELKEAMCLEPDEGCALLETMIWEKQVLEQDNYTGIMIAYR